VCMSEREKETLLPHTIIMGMTFGAFPSHCPCALRCFGRSVRTSSLSLHAAACRGSVRVEIISAQTDYSLSYIIYAYTQHIQSLDRSSGLSTLWTASDHSVSVCTESVLSAPDSVIDTRRCLFNKFRCSEIPKRLAIGPMSSWVAQELYEKAPKMNGTLYASIFPREGFE
jgi:hypothetical protein